MDERGMESQEQPIRIIGDSVLQAETDAERLMAALETLVNSDRPEATEAAKHRARLNFSSQRLRELHRLSQSDGGVFGPARAEVSLSILEGHTALAAAFINRTVRRTKRVPGRRELRVEIDEALSAVDEDAQAA